MNALELAAEIEQEIANQSFETYADEEWHKDIATMLRILDGQLAFRINAVESYQKIVEQQQAEIEHLKGLIVLLKMQVNGLKKASEK
jgi:hypothetical protein